MKKAGMICAGLVLLSTAALAESRQVVGKAAAPRVIITGARDVIWRDPGDVTIRDLFYGSGGKDYAPRGKFTFVKEDDGGSTPKFDVRDQKGTVWKVKLGPEARAETAATRFLWAAGYFTDDDYVVPVLRVANMPTLRRGQERVEADGSIRNARLERHLSDVRIVGKWSWRDNPFAGTRELNGLRVLMALMNNWDLKDSNTAVYQISSSGGTWRVFLVSDVGASFGSTAYVIPSKKGNLGAYTRSDFVTDVTPEEVSFKTPSRSPIASFFVIPHMVHTLARAGIAWIGKDIPREDARWIGDILSRLTRRQIRDAFEGAGYSPEEVEGFTAIVEGRIGQLTEL
jgi:hypothetical protein